MHKMLTQAEARRRKSQRTVFGKALGRQRGRVIGEYTVTQTATKHGGQAHWRLLPRDGSGTLGP